MKSYKTILIIIVGFLFNITNGFAAAPVITSFFPTSGSVGALVTITGTDLNPTTAFSIGGVPALVISNTGTTLIGMVMPGAVMGTIAVTTTVSTAVSSTNFTVTTTPYPYTQQGLEMDAAGNGNHSGWALALSADGKTAISGTTSPGAGQANIFTSQGTHMSAAGGALIGSGASSTAQMGYAVALSADGNTAASGGYMDNSGQGAVWVFTSVGGVWSQQGTKLVGTGNIGAASQGVALALSADGNTMLVGGLADNSNQGATWVFVRSGSVWTQQGGKLVGTGNTGAANQGKSVALSADGNTAIIGGPLDNGNQGAIWIFTRSGSVWTQQGNKIKGADNAGNAEQGWSVAVSADGNTLIEGGFADNSNQGAAWVFTRSASTWTQQGSKIIGSGSSATAQVGTSVALCADGTTAMVGGPSDNANQGAAWVYKLTAGSWIQKGNKLIGNNVSTATANQGQAVAISADGTFGLVGGPNNGGSTGGIWQFIVPDNNSKLALLTCGPGILTPAFSGTTLNYSINVPNGTLYPDVRFQTVSFVAKTQIRVNGGAYINSGYIGDASKNPSLLLNGGDNTIQINAIAQDDISVTTYYINVNRAKTTQTITFSAQNTVAYNAADYAPAATSSNTTIPITYTSSNIAVATITAGGLIHIVGFGTTNITASQAGNSNYEAATAVQTLTITPPPPGITSFDLTAGSPGSTVTITGTNFTGATSVTFGSTPAASFTVQSPTSITAVVGVGSSGNITITTPTGTGSIAGFNFIFSLPANNFNISVNSATCRGSNNGAINITATQNLNYTAILTGGGVNSSVPFTTATNINNLTAGTYNLCFTVAGQSAYQKCFTIVVTEPKDLSVYTAVNNANKSLTLSLDGGNSYSISLNGITTTTTSNNITLPLNNGVNNLSVTTDKICQGVVQKQIDMSEVFIAYPNPFASILNLNLGNDSLTPITIMIYNTNGYKVYSKQLNNQSGVAQFDLSALPLGMYVLKVLSDHSEKTYTVLKK